ncbi:MAG TPA: glutamine amidotransferase [Myxococcales bacterium]|nr:glutamine amidotransferase [Myxococcales bacterium]
MSDAAYNAWRITSLSTLPAWLLALALCALAAGVWLSFRGFRSEPAGARRIALLGFRLLAALLVLVLLLEPGIELRSESRVRARIVLLFDTSRSMKYPASPGGPSRAQELQKWAAQHKPDLAQLASQFQVDVYGFDKELQPMDPSRLPADPQGPATDLMSALTGAASAGTGGRPLAGLFTASDGADNAELGEGLSPAAAETLRKLGAPVFALPIGAQAQKDLAVEKIAVDDFAFVRNQVTLDVTLSARGFGATDVPVTLRREGQVVAQKSVRVGGDRSRYEVKLTFVPDRTGKFAFTVGVPVYEGEALAQNNQKSFVLKVIRDRVRVLLVVGRPSWDVRFLRQLLKRDPNVDLISFFILRTPGDDPHSSQDELSLIPFPTQEIFQEQLKTFDLVIFQNFNHRPYRMSQYLDGIAEYVRDGGAFAMIGGDQSFSAGDYSGTPIEDILPVTLLPPGPTAIDETPASLHLTDAGRRHPVTELAANAALNDQAWGALPKLPGLNTTGPLKGGAQVLLQSGEGRPVLVVGEAGRGRALALLSDSSWYWSFVAAGAQLGPRAYETFWHSAIRWLVRDPALTPMRVAAERPSFEPAGSGSEPPALDVQVRGSDYGAAAGARISVVESSAEDPVPRAAGSAVAGPDGNARIVLPSLPPGAYKTTVTARRADGTEVGEAEDAFVVAPASRELIEAAPRPDLLAAIAAATKGRVIDAGDALAKLPWRDPERVEVGQRTSKPLWDNWKVLVLLCCVVGAEWTLRRRWGYA